MSTEPSIAAERPLRSDAARNRARVIEAALEVFGEHGLDAPIPEVAARAGVGKATIYRSYPTREHLVGAIVVHMLDEHLTRIGEALREPDAWDGLVDMLLHSPANRYNRTLSACLAAAIELPDVVEARATTAAALDALMARAQKQGRMRPGITSADLRVFSGGIGHMLETAQIDDAQEWRRYVGLMLDAFRAEGQPALALMGAPPEPARAAPPR